MMKKLLLSGLSGISLLALGCGDAETKTFVANEISFPADDDQSEQFGRDQDGDGAIDNNLDFVLSTIQGAAGIDLNDTLNAAVLDGTILIGIDVTAADFVNDDAAEAVGYLAELVGGGTPIFDGTDQIAPSGDEFIFNDVKIANGQLSTGKSDFELVLPLDANNPTVLALENTVIEGSIGSDGSISGGKLSGTIQAVELAKNLNGVGALIDGVIGAAAAIFSGGAPIACDGAADGAAAACSAVVATGKCTDSNNNGTATGVCLDGTVDAGLFLLLTLGDANKNGQVEVEFDDALGEFSINELSTFFNIPAAGEAPVGLLGGALFDLDLDENGVVESGGVGIGFASTAATR